MNFSELNEHKKIHEEIESLQEKDIKKISSKYYNQYDWETKKLNFLKLIHSYPKQTLTIDKILTDYLDKKNDQFDAYNIMISTLEAYGEIERICLAINGKNKEDNFNINYKNKKKAVEFLIKLIELKDYKSNNYYNYSNFANELDALFEIRTPFEIRTDLLLFIELILNNMKLSIKDKATQQEFINMNNISRHHTVTIEIFKQVFNISKIEYPKNHPIQNLKSLGKFNI